MNFTEGKYVQDRSREDKAFKKGIKYQCLWNYIMRNARFKDSKHFSIGQVIIESYTTLIEKTKTNGNKRQFNKEDINRALRFFKDEGWIEVKHKNRQILIFVIDYKETQKFKKVSEQRKLKKSVEEILQKHARNIWKTGDITIEPSI